MPTLPASSDFTGASVTEGQFKTALTGLRGFLAGLLGADGLNATALATLGALGSGYAAKTAAYTVVTADRGRVLNCSGSWTLSLPAAATAGAGFSLAVRVETGTITVDPSGADLIDGSATAALVGGRAAWLVCTGTEWLRLSMPRAQSTATDATADRLMAVGAFGLGASSVIDVSDFDALTAAGIYRNSAAATGAPVPGTASWTLIHLPFISSAAFQIAGRVSATTAVTLYARRKNASAWGAWSRVMTLDALLGTVSQAAGVPTGGVLESGSNANGRYERRADGVQDCWHSMAASAGAAATWAFPAAFIETPVINGNAIATLASSVVLDAAPTTTAATFSARDKTDARRADTVHLHAVGRWSTMT